MLFRRGYGRPVDDSGPDRIDPDTGSAVFGDGEHGAVPTTGNKEERTYRDGGGSRGRLDSLTLFEAGWERFCALCFDTVAPEATYQAWFAHFLMEQFDVLQVVREVDFGSKHLHASDQSRFTGSNLLLDIMILREPHVSLPRRALLGPRDPTRLPNERSGIGRLGEFLIISELKVGSTQDRGLEYSLVLRDIHKLDALIRAAQHDYPSNPVPTAVMCILDNNSRHRMSREHLATRLQEHPPQTAIQTLIYPPDRSVS